ncbi:MAG: NAD(P)-dependent oxidoreductase [Hyphomicrobiaceae bacterium]|nr:MAG: NAD(P)-dependent oxidoreductase [Hyphomicrobiaceae bacterium]
MILQGKPTVGVAGVGNMGAPMARTIAKAGFPVVLFDLNAKALEAFGGEGGFALAETLEELGQRCDIVVTMLPNSSVVRAAVMGRAPEGGIADGLAARKAKSPNCPAIILDMSSSFALDTRRLGAELKERGIRLIDAPVSGGVPKARAGTLAIMAGGEASAIVEAEPVLKSMGNVIRTGDLGSGHAMKAINNYVSAAGLIATAEALLIGERLGLAPQTIARVLNAATGKNNTTENKLTQYMIPRTFNAGFALDLMAKDVAMARALARELGIRAPALDFVSADLDEASATLGPGADHTAVLHYRERKAATKES